MKNVGWRRKYILRYHLVCKPFSLLYIIMDPVLIQSTTFHLEDTIIDSRAKTTLLTSIYGTSNSLITSSIPHGIEEVIKARVITLNIKKLYK